MQDLTRYPLTQRVLRAAVGQCVAAEESIIAMSKVKEQIVHFVDDWTHADALARTGFWGAYGGAGSIFLACDTGRLLLARRSHHVGCCGV